MLLLAKRRILPENAIMEQKPQFTAESLRLEHMYLAGELDAASANHRIVSDKAVEARGKRTRAGKLYSSIKHSGSQHPMSIILEGYADQHDRACEAAVEAEDAALETRRKVIEAQSEYLGNILDSWIHLRDNYAVYIKEAIGEAEADGVRINR
jgi:hypothetical protein